jgi:hypothetical protein
MILNIGRGLMLLWFLTGLGHVLAPELIHHDFHVVGGVLQMIVAVALFSLMTRTARRRKAVATVKDVLPT